MSYVNFRGEAVALDPTKHAKPKATKPEKGEYHNGWRVQGVPPGALEQARLEQRNNPRWDEQNWLMNCRRVAVRSKPYEIPQAAQEAKALAEKSGWLRVEVVELKKERGVTATEGIWK